MASLLALLGLVACGGGDEGDSDAAGPPISATGDGGASTGGSASTAGGTSAGEGGTGATGSFAGGTAGADAGPGGASTGGHQTGGDGGDGGVGGGGGGAGASDGGAGDGGSGGAAPAACTASEERCNDARDGTEVCEGDTFVTGRSCRYGCDDGGGTVRCLGAIRAPFMRETICSRNFRAEHRDLLGGYSTEVCNFGSLQPQGAGLPPICVLRARTVAVPEGTTFTVTGANPLLVVATGNGSTIAGTINVAGVVDAGASGTSGGPGEYSAEAPPNLLFDFDARNAAQTTPMGAIGPSQAGAPGGSHMTAGGDGGAAETNSSEFPGGTARPAYGALSEQSLIGGAPGAGFDAYFEGENIGTYTRGGGGGGAIGFVACDAIVVEGTATINAAGGAGETDRSTSSMPGGSGGGAGGTIFLEAPTVTVRLGAALEARGGGGTSGGEEIPSDMDPSRTRLQQAGIDGFLGGFGGGAITGGDGGDGFGSSRDGAPGVSPDPVSFSTLAIRSGGGGGGGDGRIVLVGESVTFDGVARPPRTIREALDTVAVGGPPGSCKAETCQDVDFCPSFEGSCEAACMTACAVAPRSASSCATLGWSSPAGRAAVCTQSSLPGGCIAAATFAEAETACASAGGRLCTLPELLRDESKGGGCNFDLVQVWSSTPCAGGGHARAAGATMFAQGVACAVDGTAAVRCCADEDPSSVQSTCTQVDAACTND